jgi:hypothetical protein
MSLREELESAIELHGRIASNWEWEDTYNRACSELIRDHGQALLEAVDRDDSYKADEFGLAFVNGMGWVVQCSRAIAYVAELAKVVDTARSKTVDGGGA